MIPFDYLRATAVGDAVAKSTDSSALLAGGTSLVDLMKLEVLKPDRLVDIGRLPLGQISVDARGATLGALATNTQVAQHEGVRHAFPVIAEAILAGASPQLRNVATVGGNLLQRTRCAYYRDLTTPCYKREPGSGCAALEGWNRMHAVLGTSDHCIATHPSDFCVALAALDAVVKVTGPKGDRDVKFGDLHLLPEDHPEREFSLDPGELITAVFVPASGVAARSRYVKVRDRAQYAFALASCAAGLAIEHGRITQARVAIGGVATKPWRCPEVETALIGQKPSPTLFDEAAALAMRGAQVRPGNAYKVPLAQRTIAKTLTLIAERT